MNHPPHPSHLSVGWGWGAEEAWHRGRKPSQHRHLLENRPLSPFPQSVVSEPVDSLVVNVAIRLSSRCFVLGGLSSEFGISLLAFGLH